MILTLQMICFEKSFDLWYIIKDGKTQENRSKLNTVTTKNDLVENMSCQKNKTSAADLVPHDDVTEYRDGGGLASAVPKHDYPEAVTDSANGQAGHLLEDINSLCDHFSL